MLCASEKVKAWVAPAFDGWISFFPHDIVRSEKFGQKLSLQLGMPVLVTVLHDSDLFCYLLLEQGQTTEEFISKPELLRVAPKAVLVPDRISILLQAGESLPAVKSLLSSESPVFAEQRMADFLSLLHIRNGLSSYSYIERGERDNLWGRTDFVHFPDRAAEKERRKVEKHARLAHKRSLRESGKLLYDSELLRKEDGFGRWTTRVLGSGPNSSEFLVSGHNDRFELTRWIPPGEPLYFGGGFSVTHGSAVCFLPDGRILAATSDGLTILDQISGATFRIPGNATGNPIAYDAKHDMVYLQTAQTLDALIFGDARVVFSIPFQFRSQGIQLHPTHPHLVWTTQRTLGITHALTGESLLELDLYNAQLIPKKRAQWLAENGMVPSTHADVLEREDFMVFRLDASGERLFAGTSEGLREYRYTDVLRATERMPLPVAGFEVSEKLQDGKLVNSIALDERRTRVIYSSGNDSIRYYDWMARTRGILKAPDEAKRIWEMHLSGDTSRLLCRLGADRDNMQKRTDDHWVQVWDYERLSTAREAVQVESSV